MAHRIAVIPGDGIGQEVVPQGMRALEAAGRRFGFDLEWTLFDWSCEVYTKTGRMMPEDALETIKDHNAILLGAVGAGWSPGAGPKYPVGGLSRT